MLRSVRSWPRSEHSVPGTQSLLTRVPRTHHRLLEHKPRASLEQQKQVQCKPRASPKQQKQAQNKARARPGEGRDMLPGHGCDHKTRLPRARPDRGQGRAGTCYQTKPNHVSVARVPEHNVRVLETQVSAFREHSHSCRCSRKGPSADFCINGC